MFLIGYHHYLDQEKSECEWSPLCEKKILMNLYKLGVPECVSVRTMLLIFTGKHYFILKLKLNVADVNEMSTIDRKNFFMSNLVHV